MAVAPPGCFRGSFFKPPIISFETIGVLNCFWCPEIHLGFATPLLKSYLSISTHHPPSIQHAQLSGCPESVGLQWKYFAQSLCLFCCHKFENIVPFFLESVMVQVPFAVSSPTRSSVFVFQVTNHAYIAPSSSTSS